MCNKNQGSTLLINCRSGHKRLTELLHGLLDIAMAWKSHHCMMTLEIKIFRHLADSCFLMRNIRARIFRARDL